MQQIKQMIKTVQAAQNPQAALNQMITQNPQLQQVMQIVNQYGGDPDKAFQAVAEQYGVTPQDVIDFFN